MMKRFIFLFVLSFFFVCSAFAAVFPVSGNMVSNATCPLVPSYKDATFCHEFKATVLCNCHNAIPNPKLWPVVCATVSKIYEEMMIQYGSIKAGCVHRWGKNDPTDLTECRNQWHCAISGTPYTSGAVCSGNPAPGAACPNINN